LFRKINIIGLGLIGGSLARCCKKYHLGDKIFGYDQDDSQNKFAFNNQIIDQVFNFKNIEENELIIICSPLFSYDEIFRKIQPLISQKTLIIDIGSLKEFTFPLAKEILQEKAKNFIACHPIAGSEKSGILNSKEDLFFNKKVLISKSLINEERDINKIEQFWQKIGSKPEFIDAKKHDEIFALVSHFPQFLAFAAQEDFQDSDDKILNHHFRLQNSNLKMWREIFDLNRVNIEYYLQFYLKNIDNMIALLNEEKYENTKTKREALVYCFLNLPNIEKFKKYAGSGFKDFTAINHNLKKPKILAENKDSLIKFLNNIKSKIHELK
jgi:prephenate dehydrogenase